ncbi:MAG: 50S ribosomal protein L3 [Candidatus Wildermuthbacteria bacterium]|nr:50S ribosomal protein L3 [Candidatus Wildermuthbacteria bacterium]
MKMILGKKIGMTRVFKGDAALPVTLVEVLACEVLFVKTKDRDGYDALQVGCEKLPDSKQKKSMKGRNFKTIMEFRMPASDAQTHEVGSVLDCSLFEEGGRVRVSGMSKGKGFQGGVKRWGFHGRNSSHGTKHEERTIGSTGGRFPQHVVKGRKMPGHTGYERVTVKNLLVAAVDASRSTLALKGAVPGRKGTLLEIIQQA